MQNIRVRFAPSPTGSLHIGGARTALFNWLFARKNAGTFVLRLEDTDLSRSTEASASGILDGLRWLGLDWDEGPEKGGDYGPYRQGERMAIYQKYLNELIKKGKAYYCFCSPEELQAEKEKCRQEKRDYKYSGKCSALHPDEIKQLLAEGRTPVIRFRSPRDGVVVVQDLIRGNVTFDNHLLDDFIIGKSDGGPTYNFAVVVDDHEMHISHVIRAEEHLSNTPKQIILYEAMGWKLPQFAHVSMILAPDRSKLSKRHGATSVQEFRDEGYLPEALINYLALLGWSSGRDEDFWTIQELSKEFSLDNISRSPAIYDTEKLTWMNSKYLTEANSQRICELLAEKAHGLGLLLPAQEDYFLKVVDLVKSRAKTLPDILHEADYFFQPADEYDAKGINKYFRGEDNLLLLQAALRICQQCALFTAAELEAILRSQADDMNIKPARIIHPTRLAISGRTATPGLFETMELLGKDRCIERIQTAIRFAETLIENK